MAKKDTGISCGLYIGTLPQTVSNVEKAILSILAATHTDEETKREALKVLHGASKAPENTSISSCSFQTK